MRHFKKDQKGAYQTKDTRETRIIIEPSKDGISIMNWTAEHFFFFSWSEIHELITLFASLYMKNKEGMP